MPVDKSPARVREMFDRISPSYDQLNRLLSLGLDRSWRAAAARALGKARRVLDLACGTGDMAQAAGLGRTVGADFSLAMLRRAGRKFPTLRRVAAHALHLPFATGAFDACSIAFGLRNLTAPDTALREIARILRPGGTIVLLELFSPRGAAAPYVRRLVPFLGRLLVPGPVNAYRYLADSIAEFLHPRQLADLLQAAGFADTSVRPLHFGAAAILVARRTAP